MCGLLMQREEYPFVGAMLDDDVDVDRPLWKMDSAIDKFMGETNKSKDFQLVEERILYILLRERIRML
jgi:hypothetical protein